jgi:hypothetical protein
MNLKLFTVAVAAVGAATYLYRRQVARHAAFDIPVYPEIDDGADMGVGGDLAVLGDAPANEDLFSARSQRRETAGAPGLPDLTRGA